MAAAAAHSPADDLAPPSEKIHASRALEVHVSGDCCRRRVVFPDSCCQKLVPPRLQRRCNFSISLFLLQHHLNKTVFGMPA